MRGSPSTTGGLGPALGRRFGQVALVFLVAGCTITPEKKADTVNAINRAFQTEYEAILNEQGTRVFNGVSRDRAFATMRTTMLKLGMQIVDENQALGYLSVRGPAPRPADAQEWSKASEADLPKARAIVAQHLGWVVAQLFTFDPEGLDIVMNVTFITVPAGEEISLTLRMRETAPPKGDLPRREYAPPTAVRIGLDKIWREFEQTLRATGAGRR